MNPSRILTLLNTLYTSEQARAASDQIANLIEGFHRPPAVPALSEKDAILITYADTFRRAGEPPLQTLEAFLTGEAQGAINGVHILPFYPSSSDDGFAVIDYRQVDPALGGWEDVTRIGGRHRLMFDGVINHVSAGSEWFRHFKKGIAPYTDYFIVPGADWDLSRVARPRTLPLLTEVQTAAGPRRVWTTFSADQIDLNYANPAVLVEILGILLEYVQRGASLIRLDAIAYLWKEPGTTCLHLPQTHAVVKLIRAVLDETAPWVQLVTETNVPHTENISYFGSGDEAQMVYQFPLAPLVLDAIRQGRAETLSRWAAGLGETGIFFNFLASHDGIGVMPARGLLSDTEIEALAASTLAHGGQVSYRSNPDGSQSPYELNITLYDALNDPAKPGRLDVPRFLAAQAVMLSLAGVPGVYVHSLFGTPNWHEGVNITGRARSINRMPFDYPSLQARLADPASREARIFTAYRHMLNVRNSQPAFHPRGGQRVIAAGPGVFALERTAPGGGAQVLCLINLSAAVQRANISAPGSPGNWLDLLGGETYSSRNGRLLLTLKPFQVLWLKR